MPNGPEPAREPIRENGNRAEEFPVPVAAGPRSRPGSIRLSFKEVCFHGSMFRVILASLWMVIAVPATLPGLAYYLTPLQERPFVPGHDLFASSAIVGHGYGVLGAAMIGGGRKPLLQRARSP